MKMRYFNLAVLLVVIAVIGMAGFRGHRFHKPPFELFPDMNYQPKVKDQQPSTFFADGMASRPPVDGTVAEEMPAVLDYWATGKFDATHWGDGIPVHPARDGGRALEISDADMARGRERFQVSCAVCHGATGAGNGITTQYGIPATSYQSDRLRQMNDGEIFNTITNGKGQMFPLGYNIAIDDRWRIIMYIRALQHSNNAKLEDASPKEQQQLNAPPKTTDNFKIQYLDKQTMVGWADDERNFPASLKATPGELQEVEGVLNGTRPPMGGIKYLNQKNVKGWTDTIQPEAMGEAIGQ